MFASEPPSSVSNWDLSPIIDTIQHPTVSFASFSKLFRANPHGSEQRQPKQYGGDGADSRPMNPEHQHVDPKLGDLSALWSRIDFESTASRGIAQEEATSDTLMGSELPHRHLPTLTTLQQPHEDTTFREKSHTETTRPLPGTDAIQRNNTRKSRSASHLPAWTILQRAGAKPNKNGLTEYPPSHTILKSNVQLDTPTPKAKLRPNTKLTTKAEPFFPENRGELNSETNTTISDQPRPLRSGALGFVPSQVVIPEAHITQYDMSPSSCEEKDWNLNPDTIRNVIHCPKPLLVESNKYKDAAERHVFLMTKLLRDFPEYAQLVSQVGRPQRLGSGVECQIIHVFVDMSNIIAGFHDAVKASRNIPITTRIRRLHISFANLSLIMERGRSAAKRVLSGSDRLPSIHEAEKLGYEANILDRVQKVKQTTVRQAKIQKPNSLGLHSTSRGPETVGAERWVEQGVDEILHLKILESVLDTTQPATMVLATGDAAKAEYSGGFMCMVERALLRGWNVELVSFSQVISYAYRKREFRAKWGKRFRIIELDPYVEELFD